MLIFCFLGKVVQNVNSKSSLVNVHAVKTKHKPSIMLDTNSKQPIDIKGGRVFSQILYFVDDCLRLNLRIYTYMGFFRKILDFAPTKEKLTTHDNMQIVPLLKVEWVLVFST